MQEKYEKVVNDLREEKYRTVELACKAHKMSPASYHIYRNRNEVSGEVTSKPTAVKTYEAPVYSDSDLAREVKMLREALRASEERNKKLKETIISLIG